MLAVPCGRNGVCRRKPVLAVCMWLKWSVVTGRFSTASHTQPGGNRSDRPRPHTVFCHQTLPEEPEPQQNLSDK